MEETRYSIETCQEGIKKNPRYESFVISIWRAEKEQPTEKERLCDEMK